MMGYYGYGMGAFGWIGMILFWALIILGIVYLLRALNLTQGFGQGSGDRPRASSDRALDILRERYAKGEINKEEYEQLKRDLE